MMPGLNGPAVCRRVREARRREPTHLILLTARQSKEDVAAGLESGADDYITKPFNRQELWARVRVGQRIVDLQRGLESRVQELETTLAHVQQLQGLLPICSYCRSIRDDKDYWHRLETYFAERMGTQFSHGVCPDCWETVVRTNALKHGIVLSEIAGA
jgi:phosphoserine phosphatase RsbU/P